MIEERNNFSYARFLIMVAIVITLFSIAIDLKMIRKYMRIQTEQILK